MTTKTAKAPRVETKAQRMARRRVESWRGERAQKKRAGHDARNAYRTAIGLAPVTM